MKKKIALIIIASLFVTFIAVLTTVLVMQRQSKPFKNKVADSLPKYESAIIYSNEGSYKNKTIEYGKYSYSDISDDILKNNEYLKKIDLSELDILAIDALVTSVERFDLLLGKLYESKPDYVSSITENFDLDIGSLGAPNYFFVETITSDKSDETPSPNTADEIYIYYFDIDSQTLYYMYANQSKINETVGG